MSDNRFDEVVKNINNQIKVSKIWNEFIHNIKFTNRHFANQEFSELLNRVCQREDLLSRGTKFYRARILNPSTMKDVEVLNEEGIQTIKGLSNEKMKSPPNGIATSGRANPKGISYLYLASNPETACTEVRPVLTDLISVSKFTLSKDVKVINLKNIDTEEYTLEERLFIEKLMLEFVKPVRSQDDIDYASTQYFSSFIKSKGFDGIKYGTLNSNKKEAYNLMLFDDYHVDAAEDDGTVRGNIYRVVAKEITFQKLNTVKEEVISARFDLGTLNFDEINRIALKIKLKK